MNSCSNKLKTSNSVSNNFKTKTVSYKIQKNKENPWNPN